MTYSARLAATMTVALLVSSPLLCCCSVNAEDITDPASATQSADLTLGGYFILRVKGSMAHMDAQERVDQLDSRLAPVLGTPNIVPGDVVIYDPPQAKWPVIYVLGRRFVTIDAGTAKAAGQTPLAVATTWAKRLQQVLPRVNWRPPNAPEPVIPANPSLIIATSLADVGGNVGIVTLNGKMVIRFRGLQPDGETAAERADMVQSRLNMALVATRLSGAPVTVDVRSVSSLTDTAVALATDTTADSTIKGPAELVVNDANVVAVDDAMARNAKLSSPALLAKSWAKNLLAVIAATTPPTVIVPAEVPATVPSATFGAPSPVAQAPAAPAIAPVQPVAPPVAEPEPSVPSATHASVGAP